jgi:hypothetical protein
MNVSRTLKLLLVSLDGASSAFGFVVAESNPVLFAADERDELAEDL